MLQQNPSSKLNSKPHYSSQAMDRTPKCFVAVTPHPPLPVSMRACNTRACSRARVCVCVGGGGGGGALGNE